METYTQVWNNLNTHILSQCCPIELPMVMGMFYIYGFQCSGYELHVATEHSQYS